MEEYLVENITKIANQDRVKEHCEDRVKQPFTVEKWMTRRVIYAILLFNEELKKK